MNQPIRNYPRFKYWTPLPPLELRGIGTSRVESLTHYCSRLAWTSGITVGKLVAGLQDSSNPNKGFSNRISAFCGPGEDYLEALSLLECTTGNYFLRHGTFWAIHDVLGRTGLNKHNSVRRWCPKCIEEWDVEQSWEPLVHHIRLVGRCRIHGCSLRDRCAKCWGKQPIVSAYNKSLRCIHCTASLHEGVSYQDATPFMDWVESEVFNLVRFCATPGERAWIADYKWFVEQVHFETSYTKGIRRSLIKELTRVLERAKGQRPSLRTLLNVAALQGISVVDIFQNPGVAAERPLLDMWEHYDYLPLPRSMAPDKPQRAAICLEWVLDELTGCYLPPMGAAVLLHFVVIRKVMKEAYSDLYQRYEDAYERQGSRHRRDKYQASFRLAARRVKATQRKSEELPSACELTAFLQDQLPLPGNASRAIAHSTLRCFALAARAKALPECDLPPLPHSLGWQQTCGAVVL